MNPKKGPVDAPPDTMRDQMNDNHSFWEHVPNGLKHLLDALSVGTMLGTLFQMLPNIAALLTILWTCLRIYESATVQRLLKRKD